MPKHKQHGQKSPSTILILTGIFLLLIGVFTLKNGNDSSASAAALESQLDQALAAKRPTFVFLHSLNCTACKEMMNTVADIYPDYQDSIVLIDVDVYDQSNTTILRRERLQSIPTLVFYDAQGTRQVFIGAMPSQQFRDTLAKVSTEP